jgi:hypothetical protein
MLIAFLVTLLLLIFFIVVSLVLFLQLRSISHETNILFLLSETFGLLRKGRESRSHRVQRQNSARAALLIPNTRGPIEMTPPPGAETAEYLLRNKGWFGLAKECVELFDELEEMMPDLDPARQEIALHIRLHLQEILVRAGLELIENDALFDPSRHRLAIRGQPARAGMPITSTVSPGFAIGRRVHTAT